MVLQRIQLISTKLVESLEVLVRQLREFDFLRFKVTYLFYSRFFFQISFVITSCSSVRLDGVFIVSKRSTNYVITTNLSVVLFLLYGGFLKQHVAYRSFP